MMLPLVIAAGWGLVAFLLLALGYRRPLLHWALVVYFFVSCIAGVVWAFVRWGWFA